MYYLYILKSQQKETYYIGCSDDPARRCYFHNNDSKGYTLKYRPWQLVYTQSFSTIEEALAAEKIVKNWKSKKMTNYLVKGIVEIGEYL